MFPLFPRRSFSYVGWGDEGRITSHGAAMVAGFPGTGVGQAVNGRVAVSDARSATVRPRAFAAVTGGGVPRLLCRGKFRERDNRASCRHHRGLGPLPAVLYGDLRRSHLWRVCHGPADCLRWLGWGEKAARHTALSRRPAPPGDGAPGPGGCQRGARSREARCSEIASRVLR